jgi:hypothetical protein
MGSSQSDVLFKDVLEYKKIGSIEYKPPEDDLSRGENLVK